MIKKTSRQKPKESKSDEIELRNVDNDPGALLNKLNSKLEYFNHLNTFKLINVYCSASNRKIAKLQHDEENFTSKTQGKQN